MELKRTPASFSISGRPETRSFPGPRLRVRACTPRMTNVWHMETLARFWAADSSLLLATPFRVVDLTDKADQERGIRWWEDLTASGGEGMVVKPLAFVTKDGKGWHNLPLRCKDENTSGSSTDPNTRCPNTWSGSRAEVLAPNDRLLFVNSPWDEKHWRDSYTRNSSAEFTSAFLVCWGLESEPVDPRL